MHFSLLEPLAGLMLVLVANLFWNVLTDDWLSTSYVAFSHSYFAPKSLQVRLMLLAGIAVFFVCLVDWVFLRLAKTRTADSIRLLSAFSPVCRQRTVLLEDAAPHYCRHHHSASVPLCCLLPVSLTAVSQAPAHGGRAHRTEHANVNS